MQVTLKSVERIDGLIIVVRHGLVELNFDAAIHENLNTARESVDRVDDAAGDKGPPAAS